MYSHFGKISAVVLSGLLAACASTQKSASSGTSAGRAQLALGQQSPTDAMLRAGLPTQATAQADDACMLVPAAQQGICPVQQTAVLGARQLQAPRDPKGYLWAPAGAVVYMVAAPGLTTQWLGHLVECYQARVAEAGNAVQASESCPLAEPDASYSISPTRNGFAVAIHSEHSEAAKHIFDVSQRLVPSGVPQRSALAVRR